MAETPIITPPKEGKETSSYTVALVSTLAPIALLLVIILGLIFIPDPRVKETLTQALIYLVGAGILGGAAVGVQYIGKRGDISVAKVNALAPQPSNTVSIKQESKS